MYVYVGEADHSNLMFSNHTKYDRSPQPTATPIFYSRKHGKKLFSTPRNNLKCLSEGGGG